MYHVPADLAASLDEALKARGRPTPGGDVLRELFETMYAASLKTEEGEDITFHIAFLDPSDPDPDPPRRIRSDRWRSVRLGHRVAFSIEQLMKLAKASDPRTSSLATYFDVDGPFVWGLIDQGNLYFEYLNFDSETTHAFRPGTFQASIEGPAHVTAWMDFDRVAELRGTELAGAALDALDRGPLREKLDPGLGTLARATLEHQRENAQALLNLAVAAADEDPGLEELADTGNGGRRNDEPDGSSDEAAPADIPMEEYLADDCLQALKRILIRAQNYGHGGAILISSDATGNDDLNIKYVLDYPRLRDALVNAGAHRLDHMNSSDAIHDLLNDEQDDLPVTLYLDASIAEDELNDARSEIEAVVWFISLLTRVDGLVVLTPDLTVLGFGVEITVRDEPDHVVLANDAEMSSVADLDPGHYGTRHRSMMRYCARHPDSVGFVVSQDGVVRGITRVGEST